ncbi:MAG: hypothetical protein ACKO04_09445 [Actinomycetes bacterium]
MQTTAGRANRAGQGHRAALLGLLLTLVAVTACSPLRLSRSTTLSAGEVGTRTSQLAAAPGRTAVRAAAVATPATVAPASPAPSAVPAAAPVTVAPAAPGPPAGRTDLAGCPRFPADNAFNAHVLTLPVRSDSAATLAAAGGAGQRVRAGFTSGIWQGSRGGYPVNMVDSRTDASVDYLINAYPGVSDPSGHTLPAVPRFEGWPLIAWDRHLLTVDTATCTSSEAFNVSPPWENPLGRWIADSAVHFDLRSNALPPRGSSTASGLSLLHGLVRYDEVASGRVAHAVAVTLPQIRQGAAVWPARYSDGRSTNPAAPQMGTWLRLRADVDLSALGPQARTVAEAMKVHGAVVSDTGPGGLVVNGEPDERWNDRDLSGLGALSLDDFEVVDASGMRVDDSLRAR